MSVIDCRSEEGITIGLIDTILTAAHLLAGRDLSSYQIHGALKDLAGDGELGNVLKMAEKMERIDWAFARRLLKYGSGLVDLDRKEDGRSPFEIHRQLSLLDKAGVIRFVWFSLNNKGKCTYGWTSSITAEDLDGFFPEPEHTARPDHELSEMIARRGFLNN
jgi:hypothetical protein